MKQFAITCLFFALGYSAFSQTRLNASLGLSYLQSPGNESIGFLKIEAQREIGKGLVSSIFWQSVLLDSEPRHLGIAGYSIGADLFRLGENKLIGGFTTGFILPGKAEPVIYPYLEWSAPNGAFRAERVPYQSGLVNVGLVFFICKPD